MEKAVLKIRDDVYGLLMRRLAWLDPLLKPEQRGRLDGELWGLAAELTDKPTVDVAVPALGIHELTSKEMALKFFKVYPPPDAQWFVDTALIPGLVYFFDEVRLQEAEWWAAKCGHRGPVKPEFLDKSCDECVRITEARSRMGISIIPKL